MQRAAQPGEPAGGDISTLVRAWSDVSVEETAEVLKVSPVTVKRAWRAAKVWLYRELTSGRELTGGTTDGLRTLETS
jgi:hypothetical protein